MQVRPAKTFLLCVGLLGVVVLWSGASVRLPGDDSGYEPTQPIAYSHRLHAGELGIDCKYCHFGAEKSAVAGIPPTSICMNCHATVSTSKNAADMEKLAAAAESREAKRVVSPEIAKIYRALGLGDDLKPAANAESRPIAWLRVHDLPDHVAFHHGAHVSRGVECQTCHGPVETMERVRQIPSLSMGWCVDCHRINHRDGTGAVPPGLEHPRVTDSVTTDCAACHY